MKLSKNMKAIKKNIQCDHILQHALAEHMLAQTQESGRFSLCLTQYVHLC